MTFEPGQQLGGLRIERELGRGAYGVVYLARDALIGRQVALKVLPAGETAVSEEARERVLAEARLVGNLNSPHIVTLYRLHAAPDGGWMQEMELVPGGSLEARLPEDRALPLAEAVRAFRGVCLALRTAHAARVLHGDVKPANVLFGADDVVKLADFGLARMLEETGAAVPLHGRFFGSPFYAAPEVISGRSASMASDVWSAGVLLHRALAGRMPFAATTFLELLTKVLREEPEPLGTDVPPPLSALLARCLAKQPEERPSAAAIVEELDRLAALDVRLAPAGAARERPTNVGAAHSSFVGRREDLAAVAALLHDDEIRLVTVTGPGGMGKTRLAQETCRALLDAFEGGAWFVELARADDADGVSHAVASVLGAPSAGADPARAVADALQYRRPMLLVLDNFEQVVDHAPATVGLWRQRAPHVRFLVTSRARLGLEGERVYELSPMSTPRLDDSGAGDAERATAFDGVRLFAERAREANPSFALDPENVRDVVSICALLDGMPLALELAAARAAVIRPAQIASRLTEWFQLLRSSRRDVPERQRTLAGAIAWSYDLLEHWEQDAFLQACRFRDGFSPDAFDAVVDLSAHPDAPLSLDVLQALRDKSLLTARAVGADTRLGMYHVIREFGERAARDGTSAERRNALARRHATYFVRYAEEWAARIPGPREPEALDRIDLDLGNLAAAEEWAIEAGDPALAARTALAMAETMKVRRAPRQVATMLERAAAAVGPDASEPRVRVLTHLAAANLLAGDWARAIACADEAVTLARALRLDRRLAAALLARGDVCRHRGEHAAALAAFAEAEGIARSTGDRHALAVAIGNRGIVLSQQGDLAGALTAFQDAEALGRELGDDQLVALHVGNRGIVLESRGELDAALACHREAEEVSRRIGNRLRVAVSLGNQANVHTFAGRLDAALACYREAEAVARELGAKQRIAHIVGNRGSLHALRREDATALQCCREAEAIARELGDRRRTAVALAQIGNIISRGGEADAALDSYLESERIGRELGDRGVIARALCARGAFLRTRERRDEAWDALSEGVAMYDEMRANESALYFTFKVGLAELANERGDAATAVRTADEGLGLAARIGLGPEHPDPAVQAGLATLAAIRRMSTDPAAGT